MGMPMRIQVGIRSIKPPKRAFLSRLARKNLVGSIIDYDRNRAGHTEKFEFLLSLNYLSYFPRKKLARCAICQDCDATTC